MIKIGSKLAGAMVATSLLVMTANASAQTATLPSTLPPPQPVGNGATGTQEFETDYNDAKSGFSRASLLEDEKGLRENVEGAGKFARCVINFSPDQARLVLDQAVPAKKAKKLDFAKFLNRFQGCVTVRRGLDRDILRGALAEGLITGEGAAKPIPQGGDADAVKSFIQSINVPAAADNDPFRMGQLAAECRTALAPFQVRGLIATEPGSAAEEGALTVLKSATPQCDGFKSETEIGASFERAFAAQALYFWLDFPGYGDS